MNAQFASMHDGLFDQFADACTVVRGAAGPVTTRCIVDQGVAKLGDVGQVIGRVTRLSFIKAEWDPARGDVVTFDGLTQTIEAIENDDGIVVECIVNA
jgi:hypothetical protein